MVDRFEEFIKIEFKEKELINKILTHPSKGKNEIYELYEFLGDAVHELLLRNYILKRLKIKERKKANILRSFYSSSSFMAEIIRRNNLHSFLKTSTEALLKNDSVLSSFYEAVLGAIFYSRGIKYANRFFDEFVAPLITPDVSYDPKSAVFIRYRNRAEFKIVSKNGEPHSPVYEVELYIDGVLRARGKGGSIKDAEEDASRKFLSSLNTSGKDS